MVGGADDHRLPSGGRRCRNQLMDALDLRARSVIHLGSGGAKRLVFRAADSVGADDYGVARRQPLRRIHHGQSLILQMADDVVIVDELAETEAARIGGQHLLRHLNRPAHAEAKARAFGDDQLLHSAPPSGNRRAISAQTASTLSSSVRSLVSMGTASSAARSGATARCISS